VTPLTLLQKTRRPAPFLTNSLGSLGSLGGGGGGGDDGGVWEDPSLFGAEAGFGFQDEMLEEPVDDAALAQLLEQGLDFDLCVKALRLFKNDWQTAAQYISEGFIN
jgi:hypothetical protein